MKTKYSILIMTFYALLLIVGIIYRNDIILKISTALAVISSGAMQYSDSKKTQDEREKYINERAQSNAFITVMFIILLSYIASDTYTIINNFSPSLIFEVLFGIGFMTYTSMYVYLSKKY